METFAKLFERFLVFVYHCFELPDHPPLPVTVSDRAIPLPLIKSRIGKESRGIRGVRSAWG